MYDLSESADRIVNKLCERLHEKETNSDHVFEALWAHLDRLSTRMEDSNLSSSSPHRCCASSRSARVAPAGHFSWQYPA